MYISAELCETFLLTYLSLDVGITSTSGDNPHTNRLALQRAKDDVRIRSLRRASLISYINHAYLRSRTIDSPAYASHTEMDKVKLNTQRITTSY